jgi:glycosyltransferase involved in cell wall biosynthesis
MNNSPDNPVVSICCVTFNHKEYIKEAIEGFLLQKTTFPIEIIIHDDASTDGTTEIIKSFENKFPLVIKTIYQKENQWSKGKRITPIAISRAKGKYIALCEGDDYWTDQYKLQKQVDFLEQNSDCVACHHWHKYAYKDEQGNYEVTDAPTINQGYFPQEKSTVREVFSNKLRLKTRTVLYRNILQTFPKWYYKIVFGDVALSMIYGKHGKFGFIDESMAVYRQTGQGASLIGNGKYLFFFNHYLNWIKVWEYGIIDYNYKYFDVAKSTIVYFYTLILSKYSFSIAIFLKLIAYAVFKSPLHVIKKLTIIAEVSKKFMIKVVPAYFRRVQVRFQ